MAEASEQKVDGRRARKGIKKGPRQRFYVCSAIVNKKLVQESIAAASEEEAKKSFNGSHKKDPEAISAPMFIVKDSTTGAKQVSRNTVTLNSTDLLRFTTKTFSGIYQGYKIVCNGMKAVKVGDKEYKDNELLRVAFDGPVNPENKTRKPRIGSNEVLPASKVESLKDLS